MKITTIALTLVLFCILTKAHAQTENIQFALNGRNSTDVSKNPFGKFVGEWALKNDHWTHSLVHYQLYFSITP